MGAAQVRMVLEGEGRGELHGGREGAVEEEGRKVRVMEGKRKAVWTVINDQVPPSTNPLGSLLPRLRPPPRQYHHQYRHQSFPSPAFLYIIKSRVRLCRTQGVVTAGSA